MENSNETVSFDCSIRQFGKITLTRLQPTISSLAIVTSLFCSITFWKIIRKENQQQQSGQMFKYFFASSLAELSFLSIGLAFGFVYAPLSTFATSIYFIYLDGVLKITFIFISNWYEMVATLDCYLKISGKCKSFTTKKALIIISSLIVIGGLVNPIFIELRVTYQRVAVNMTMNGTTETRYYYTFKNRPFRNTLGDTVLRVIMNTFREFVPIVCIIIINILILRTLRRVIKKKREMIKKGNRNLATYDADINKLKMIIVMSLNYVIFRSLYLYDLLTPVVIYKLIFSCLAWFGVVSYIFSYFLKFFIFYFYNKLFRKHFNSLFTCNSQADQQTTLALTSIHLKKTANPRNWTLFMETNHLFTKIFFLYLLKTFKIVSFNLYLTTKTKLHWTTLF
jgi:hypothetical protein